MHSSKGLEYRAVFIIDANETITPHKKALLLEDIEEERRLFYVAVTRAKDWLYICHCRERYGKETDVSRFVEEMVSMLDELTVGQEIRHKKFGTGKITQIRDGKIKAVFADGKEYVFDAKFCLGNGIIKV